ncbi:MAG TPA: phosphohydrolase [Patescibacteria group bacterium]|nr:phosphohydrolase [Patescibacteria group bacterium]
MKLTLDIVKKNPKIREFIHQTEIYLDSLGFTDHGFRHVNIASDRAKSISKKIGMNTHEQELAGIAAYCHDMGNFLGREQHHYWAALLFSQVFLNEADNPNDVSTIAQAIVSHDKDDLKIVNKVTAVLILADKSDVHRSRVKNVSGTNFKKDIHDRVNYAIVDNDLIVGSKSKFIILRLKLDTKFSAPLEYFEIFTERMTFCRLAANYLGYKFSLEINKFKLL